METINFNDFTHNERYEIIKDFLVKMKKADFTKNAQKFFMYYLRKFYKVPESLVNDIVYCQRAMKSHLLMHQVGQYNGEQFQNINHYYLSDDCECFCPTGGCSK